jgi:hypothetical protein
METAMKFLCALAMLLASTAACMAESEYCEIPLNPDLGKITAPSHVHFLGGRDGCPSGTPRCVLKPYLVRGDVVLLGKKVGAWQCALYLNEMIGTDGYLPMNAFQALPSAPNSPLTAWAGHWVRDKDASIDIKLKGTKLSVDGVAIWQGMDAGDVRDGEIGGDVSPKGDSLLIDQREEAKDTLTCMAMLTLSGRDLIVQDNTQCGGVNVTFTGTYKRQAHGPR